jgi:hypothetical protein
MTGLPGAAGVPAGLAAAVISAALVLGAAWLAAGGLRNASRHN